MSIGNTPVRHVPTAGARHRAPKQHRGRLGAALLTPALTGALLAANTSSSTAAPVQPSASTTTVLAATPTMKVAAARLRLPRTLKRGMRGKAVLRVQRKLRVSPRTGYFGSRTERAVKQYQTRNRLKRTGRVDVGTYRRVMSGQDRRVTVRRASRSVRVGRFARPLVGYRLTAGFGAGGRYWSRRHTGQDFAARYGTPVRSIAAGRVVKAGWAGSYGYRVVVRHRDGSSSMYAHLSRILRRGGSVNAGTLIGRVGSTGNSTGNHLHLEVRTSRGSLVSPVRYLRARGVRV